MTIKAKTITGAVYERVKSDILSGKYKPGHHLLEKELSEELEVSRTPIRDALIRLQEEGLVVLKPHKGVFVRKLTQRNIQDYYQTRAVLEGLGAELAAEHVTADAEEQFRQLLKEMKKTLAEEVGPQSDENIIKLNDQFHNFIFQLAGNEVLDKMRRTLAHPIALIRATSWINHDRKQEVFREHEQIIEAIIAKDKKLARERAEMHIHKAWKSAEYNLHQLPGDEEGN
ncbi:GntR family transcriptional regulator [Alkalihalobacillus oceani]|uniref:GntR family transcriptional regulator n=1 Tax=Halalkalibacter oceani TaxID=1653776 RepID=UPI002041C7D2|nr:GntR family transcriptional regulator [Halalkalibacter oceani]MCM3762167.1 GntR family transcriptional regulator [Halalkalibacter oceani]